ncbi:MAG: hypothetical protein PUD42_04170 [Clostridiales bacterium]|nr:hypothetical protein [Clostridiales bacterium]MDY2729276.1 hypothetical protein [Clostridium sp.]
MKQEKDTNKNDIRKSILLLLVFFLLITISLCTLVFYEREIAAQKKDINNMLDLYSYTQCNNVNNWIDEVILPLQSVKTYIESGNIKGNEDLQKILHYSSDQFSKYYEDGIYIGKSSGKFIKVAESNKDLMGNVVDEYWYKEGLTRVDINLGSVHKNSNGDFFVSATGILRDDNDVSVIGADIPLSTINAEMDYACADLDFNVLIVDKSGNIIASKDESIIGKSLSDTNNKVLVSCADKIKLESYTPFYVYNTMLNLRLTKNDEWIVISYISEDNIVNRQKRNLAKALGILTAVSIALLVVLNKIIKFIFCDFKIVNKA